MKEVNENQEETMREEIEAVSLAAGTCPCRSLPCHLSISFTIICFFYYLSLLISFPLLFVFYGLPAFFSIFHLCFSFPIFILFVFSFVRD